MLQPVIVIIFLLYLKVRLKYSSTSMLIIYIGNRLLRLLSRLKTEEALLVLILFLKANLNKYGFITSYLSLAKKLEKVAFKKKNLGYEGSQIY